MLQLLLTITLIIGLLILLIREIYRIIIGKGGNWILWLIIISAVIQFHRIIGSAFHPF